MKITRSRYEEKNVCVGNLRQEDALGFHLDPNVHEQHEIMDAIQEQVVSDPGREVVRSENPCHYGMVLSAIEKGKC